jgi:hypothetical protein
MMNDFRNSPRLANADPVIPAKFNLSKAFPFSRFMPNAGSVRAGTDWLRAHKMRHFCPEMRLDGYL